MTGERITTIANVSAAYAIGYGGYVVWPGTDLFALTPDLYAPMTQLVNSETFWGLLMIVAGSSALVLERAHRQSGKLVMWILFLSISILFFMGDPQRPGGLLFGILALANFLQWRAATWKDYHRG